MCARIQFLVSSKILTQRCPGPSAFRVEHLKRLGVGPFCVCAKTQRVFREVPDGTYDRKSPGDHCLRLRFRPAQPVGDDDTITPEPA